MALPSSGTIGMNQIRTELGIPSQAPFSLDTAENEGYVALNQCSANRPNSSNPAAISEWYSYNHSAALYTHTGYNLDSSCTLACAGPFTTTFYTCCSTFGVGCILRQNSFPYNPISPAISGYISNGSSCWTVNGNSVDAVSACAATTTTTAAPSSCKNYQLTASSFVSYTDCCGTFVSDYYPVGYTFCAQIGTVYGYYIDLGTTCNC